MELIAEDRLDEARERLASTLRLRKALGRLPATYQRVLVDHFVRGYPVKRIARRDRIPVGTILSRIFTAKRLLRAAWEVGHTLSSRTFAARTGRVACAILFWSRHGIRQSPLDPALRLLYSAPQSLGHSFA